MKNLPMYAPGNGICKNCNRSIYVDLERQVGGISKGYTSEEAGNVHIKQCPHCMYIFEKEKENE